MYVYIFLSERVALIDFFSLSFSLFLPRLVKGAWKGGKWSMVLRKESVLRECHPGVQPTRKVCYGSPMSHKNPTRQKSSL